MSKSGLWAFIAAIVLASCSGVPSGIIQPKRMATLMADIHIAEAAVEQHRSDFPSDSSRLYIKESIFARNGVTAQEFDSSLMWYGQHIEKYAEVYDLTVADIEKRINESNKMAASELTRNVVNTFQADGDSVDVWPTIAARNFTPGLPSDRITFDLKSDRHWEAGDIYRLSFKVTGSSRNINATIAADYPDGEILYVTSDFRSEGWHETTLILDHDKNPTVVYGSITAPAISDVVKVPDMPLMIDSISLVRMRKGFPGVQRRMQHKFHFK